jgi:hypothetical protein
MHRGGSPVHHSHIAKIVIDAPDSVHDTELAFWSGATGQALRRFERRPEYHGADLPGGFSLLVQRLDAGGCRVHVDIHTDDLDAEVARLERLGATRVEQVDRWWVMRDPAGLPFCVIPAAVGSLDETNSHRWD